MLPRSIFRYSLFMWNTDMVTWQLFCLQWLHERSGYPQRRRDWALLYLPLANSYYGLVFSGSINKVLLASPSTFARVQRKPSIFSIQYFNLPMKSTRLIETLSNVYHDFVKPSTFPGEVWEPGLKCHRKQWLAMATGQINMERQSEQKKGHTTFETRDAA